MAVGHGELILVVDDELVIREITKISLETYNYRVITASDGRGAVTVYAHCGVDGYDDAADGWINSHPLVEKN